MANRTQVSRLGTDSFISYDLTRGTKISLFDMYYDKFKKSLKSIEYGMGNIKPQLWNYNKPKEKKKRR